MKPQTIILLVVLAIVIVCVRWDTPSDTSEPSDAWVVHTIKCDEEVEGKLDCNTVATSTVQEMRDEFRQKVDGIFDGWEVENYFTYNTHLSSSTYAIGLLWQNSASYKGYISIYDLEDATPLIFGCEAWEAGILIDEAEERIEEWRVEWEAEVERKSAEKIKKNTRKAEEARSNLEKLLNKSSEEVMPWEVGNVSWEVKLDCEVVNCEYSIENLDLNEWDYEYIDSGKTLIKRSKQ